MAPRTKLLLLMVTILSVGTALVVDAVTLTDGERLEHFVEDFIGNSPDLRVGAALLLTDPAREAVEVVDRGRRKTFRGGEEASLSRELHRALSAFTDGPLHVIQKAVDLEGEKRARVAVRVRASEGFINVLFHLEKHDEDWLVRRVAVSS